MNPDSEHEVPIASTSPAGCPEGGQRYATLILGVVFLVFLSRVPFIHVGYGTDADAWRLADAARQIGETGRYVSSRPPGHPLQEGLCALLWTAGPIALNTCTALLSVVAIACFIKSFRALGSKDELLAGLALALTPVVFINSTNSMDYVWALAFILASHHAVLTRRPILAGCLLGLAVACRITSGAMLLPLAILAFSKPTRHGPLRAPAGFCLATVLVATAAFTPVLLEYGAGFLSFRAPPDYPPLIAVLSRATLHVWGSIGLVAIAIGLIATWANRRSDPRATSIPHQTGNAPLVSAALAIALYLFAFLLLPLDEGYMIPAVPFVILLLGRVLDRRVFRLVCLAICFSPFLCSLGRAALAPDRTYSPRALHFSMGGQQLVLDVLRGPMLREHAERIEGAAFVERVLSLGRTLPDDSVVVVGHWLPQIKVTLGPTSNESCRYVYLLDEDRLRQYEAAGVDVWFLPDVAVFNRQLHGIELHEAGATPLDLYPRR